MKQKPNAPLRADRDRRPASAPPLALRFTPYAWAKLVRLRDRGPTEIGGFGIGSSEDPLLVEDVRLVAQRADAVTVEFDDDAVAAFFDDRADEGLHPRRFGRVWIHTHPGASATPSSVDEATFARVFGGCDWSVMFVLARGGKSYARLQTSALGRRVPVELPVQIEWDAVFPGSDHAAWDAEYDACVHPIPERMLPGAGAGWPDDPRLALLGGVDAWDLLGEPWMAAWHGD